MLNEMRIQQYKTDIGFRTLVESVNENLYVIPKYQRKYRWNRKQVIELVRSLIYGLPIPPIYTCRNEWNQLEILDGQQRVMSLFFYYIGYYLRVTKNSCVNFSELETEGKSFKEALLQSNVELEELHIVLDEEGKSVNVDYGQLPVEWKRRIDYTPLTVIEIKIDGEGKKPEVLRQIFKNLNKGGSLLSQQEQRNGIYDCAFYDMLREFNQENEKWKKVWGNRSSKEQDLEALLRFCALNYFVSVEEKEDDFEFKIKDYHGSYEEMLDRFSEKAMCFDPEQIDGFRKSLIRFLELFQVSNKKFSKITLLESFYVIHEKKGLNFPVTDKLCESILDADRYTSNSRQGTVKIKKMNERWKAVYEIWIGANR